MYNVNAAGARLSCMPDKAPYITAVMMADLHAQCAVPGILRSEMIVV